MCRVFKNIPEYHIMDHFGSFINHIMAMVELINRSSNNKNSLESIVLKNGMESHPSIGNFKEMEFFKEYGITNPL